MSQNLIRLLYLSTAHAEIEEADVLQITAHASKANETRMISGALAFNGRGFCQCLEGEEDEVHGLLDLIKKDKRHSDIRTIAKLNIETRYFSGWRMHWVFDLSFSELRDAMESHPLPKHS